MGNTCKSQSDQEPSSMYEYGSINYQMQTAEESSISVGNHTFSYPVHHADDVGTRPSSPDSEEEVHEFEDSSWVLPYKTDNIRTHYKLRKELTRRSTEVLRLCVDRRTGERLACKSLSKLSLSPKGINDIVERELQQDFFKSRFVQLRGLFEDRTNLHIVMEVSGINLAEEENDMF